MPPRLRCPSTRAVRTSITRSATSSVLQSSSATAQRQLWPGSSSTRQYATAPALRLKLPDDYVPPTQPPSARPPEMRKSQLIRTYTSLLRSTPLMLIFQHNNLSAGEWAALRRELRHALAQVQGSGAGSKDDITDSVKLQVIRTRMFDVAMRIVEFYDPTTVNPEPGEKKLYNHDLSKAAWVAMKEATKIPDSIAGSRYAELSPLMIGPLALLILPAVSPAHLAAALSILSPSPPAFPAPTRRKNPGYYDPVAQSALQKLLLVGGRIEGKVFDLEGVRWVGGIEGGLDGLRAQLVAMLQSAGLGLTGALEGASRSLWLTMEGRKMDMEQKEKGEGKEESKEEVKEEDK